ncbi:MAG: hypothetical protein A2Z18_03475 [Armatimonadetes bacterium RBG_16_58_9]|nr:MAG: hypothetical protein A2Z18_03475 [Armatimonadetes bacterium RBG_16_58_9]
MRKSMSRNAFTLTELLITIGIIAVLAAIIVPVTVRGVAKSKQATCMSNLRQIGVAISGYAQDNWGRLPPYSNIIPGPEGGDQSEGYPAPEMLYAALFPYIRNSKILYCPSDPFAGQEVVRWGVYHLYSSYHFNFRKNSLKLREDGYWFSSGRRALPQHCPIARDANSRASIGPGGVNVAEPGCQHFDGANILYLDGHVKWQVMGGLEE